MEQTSNDFVEEKKNKVKKTKKQVWTIIGIVVLCLAVFGAGTGGYLINLSNTSPEFCATCHIMETMLHHISQAMTWTTFIARPTLNVKNAMITLYQQKFRAASNSLPAIIQWEQMEK